MIGTEKQGTPKPVSKELSIPRIIVSLIFGKWLACSYCGKFYADCHSNDMNIFWPAPQEGKCCPDGHEGYYDEFFGYAIFRHWFDDVADPPAKT